MHFTRKLRLFRETGYVVDSLRRSSKIKNVVRLVTINLMQYLINIDWFLRSPPLQRTAAVVATAAEAPLKSCTMESEILLQFHFILPKVIYFRIELHPIVKRQSRRPPLCNLVARRHPGDGTGASISFDTNIVVRCNTKPSCASLYMCTGRFHENLS